MGGNSYGQLFRITTFGESHGAGIGVVIDGCPAGLEIDLEFIQAELRRRRPGQSALTTSRTEEDQVDALSGLFEGKSTGAPIALFIRNKDQRSGDYDALKDVFRPSHADFTYQAKYGLRDHRGGGRSSARETAARVAAGAVANLFLRTQGIMAQAYVSQVGKEKTPLPHTLLDLSQTEENELRCPDAAAAERMRQAILDAKEAGDSLGGIITCIITGCPPGLGEPVFDKLHAELGKAMLGINAVKGFEIGSGFAAAEMRGSEHNDAFFTEDDAISTRTNLSGGVQGGISNGTDIYFRVAFKPVATIAKPQKTVNQAGESVIIAAKGRHDPCVVPRAVPIVEAMAALVVADFVLRARGSRV